MAAILKSYAMGPYPILISRSKATILEVGDYGGDWVRRTEVTGVKILTNHIVRMHLR